MLLYHWVIIWGYLFIATSGSALEYDSCKDILRNGVRDTIFTSNSTDNQLATHYYFCSEAKQHNLNRENFHFFAKDMAKRGSSSSNQYGGSLGLVVPFVLLNGDYKQVNSKENMSEVQKEMFLNDNKEKILDYYQKNCVEESYDESIKSEAVLLSKIANAGIVNAWRECMLEKTGFFAHIISSSSSEDTGEIEYDIMVSYKTNEGTEITALSLRYDDDKVASPYVVIKENSGFVKTVDLCQSENCVLKNGSNLSLTIKHKNRTKSANVRVLGKTSTGLIKSHVLVLPKMIVPEKIDIRTTIDLRIELNPIKPPSIEPGLYKICDNCSQREKLKSAKLCRKCNQNAGITGCYYKISEPNGKNQNPKCSRCESWDVHFECIAKDAVYLLCKYIVRPGQPYGVEKEVGRPIRNKAVFKCPAISSREPDKFFDYFRKKEISSFWMPDGPEIAVTLSSGSERCLDVGVEIRDGDEGFSDGTFKPKFSNKSCNIVVSSQNKESKGLPFVRNSSAPPTLDERQQVPVIKTTNIATLDVGQFVTIPGGIYEIGSPETDANHEPNENLHSIWLSSFSIMDAAVTQEIYAKVMGANPAHFKTVKYDHCPQSFKIIDVMGKKIPVCANHPAQMISWEDARKFAELLSNQDVKYTYSLPTEAQLEVAFRGGTKTAYVTGRDDETGLAAYVWYRKNPGHLTYPEKSKLPNAFGIYRSSVREWACDWYEKNCSFGLDPQGPTSGKCHVSRGGDAGAFYAESCRSARREYQRSANVGFRLVRTLKEENCVIQ